MTAVRHTAAALFAGAFLLASPGLPSAAAGAIYTAVRDTTTIPGQPYHRFTTTDRFARTITFFLADEPDGTPPLPLVVYVQGSGAQSHFREKDGKIVGATGHSPIADICRGRARFMIVEKPGVAFLSGNGGGARDASEEFRREHTLDRWAEAIRAAVEAARGLPEVADGPTLLIGHSEGGISASAAAAIDDHVTHVAILSGGGPTQFYDLMDGAKKGYFFGPEPDSAERVNYLLGEWAKIMADPMNPDSSFFGHPWRRWSTFCASSTLEEILKSRTSVYVAQGTEDNGVAPESFDILKAGLMARGRDAVFERVPGANHSFAFADRHEDGWVTLMQRVLAWFEATR